MIFITLLLNIILNFQSTKFSIQQSIQQWFEPATTNAIPEPTDNLLLLLLYQIITIITKRDNLAKKCEMP